jgi:membrane protein required for colicin V production
MNYLDIIIAVSLLYGLIKGFSNGLVKEVTSLLALFIGVYVAINFSEYLEPKFIDILDGYQEFVPVLAFGILFLVSVLCIKALGFIIDKLTKALALGIFSRVLGGVFGVLKVVVIFSFLLFFFIDYNLVNKQAKEDSVLFEPLADLAKTITPKLKKHQTILDKIDKETKRVKEKINQEN